MRLLCLFFFAGFAATSAEKPINQVYDLVVKGGNMQKCNFDLYAHYKDKWTPETSLTCTRNWYSGRVQSPDALHNYYWPWCVQTVDGSYYGRWDSCYEYSWKFTVSDDRQPLRRDMGLWKDYSLTTEYLYRYHNTHTSYSDARKICKGLGSGWGLATFQSLNIQATLKRYNKDKVVSYYENPYWREYDRRNYTHWSEQNVIDIISPLQQTFDHFWIRNDDSNEWKGADQDGSKGGLFNFKSYGKPFYWKPYCFYYNAEQLKRGQSPIQWTACYYKKSFVCERHVEG